ncbi:hypothetical protein OKW45_007443 [Paraburkholderia sp. WSM4175]
MKHAGPSMEPASAAAPAYSAERMSKRLEQNWHGEPVKHVEKLGHLAQRDRVNPEIQQGNGA